MPKKRLPKSQRKYIRREKARIRREVLNLKEQEKLIQKLYQKIPRTRNGISGIGVEKIKAETKL